MMTSLKRIIMKKVLVLGLLIMAISGCGKITVDGDWLDSDTGNGIGMDTSVDTMDTLSGTETIEPPAGTETTDPPAGTETIVPPDGSDSEIPIMPDTDTIETDTGDVWSKVTAMTGCGCNEATEVCGADGACVPRCDDKGRCLEGVAEGKLTPIALEGNKLFLEQAPAFDKLNNQINAKVLWMQDLDSGQLSVVWDEFDDYRLMGVAADGAIVLLNTTTTPEYTVVKVFTDGTVENIVLPEGFSSAGASRGILLDNGWIYSWGPKGFDLNTIDNAGVRRFSIDGSATLELVLSAHDFATQTNLDISNLDDNDWRNFTVLDVDDGIILFREGFQDGLGITYMYKVGTDPAEMQSSSFGRYEGYLSSELSQETVLWYTDVISSDAYFQAWDYLGGNKNCYLWEAKDSVLYISQSGRLVKTYNGWAYMLDSRLENLVSFPFTVAYTHQTLFSVDIMPLESWGIEKTGETYSVEEQNPVFYGSHGMVWSQFERDSTTGDVVKSLIASIPLPPRMCDAELPCTGEGETCGADGYCTAQ